MDQNWQGGSQRSDSAACRLLKWVPAGPVAPLQYYDERRTPISTARYRGTPAVAFPVTQRTPPSPTRASVADQCAAESPENARRPSRAGAADRRCTVRRESAIACQWVSERWVVPDTSTRYWTAV